MDKLSPERRSANMAAIRSTGMKPEMLVRSATHRLGYRYRLHARDLPGKPDLVFRSRRKVIFVHGCFWHQHEKSSCLDGRQPKSNTGYWSPKLASNVARDERNLKALQELDWDVLVIWDCETKSAEALSQSIKNFLR